MNLVPVFIEVTQNSVSRFSNIDYTNRKFKIIFGLFWEFKRSGR